MNLAGRGRGSRDGKLEVVCWCGKKTKKLPPKAVRRGETFSCNLRCWKIGEQQRGQKK